MTAKATLGEKFAQLLLRDEIQLSLGRRENLRRYRTRGLNRLRSAACRVYEPSSIMLGKVGYRLAPVAAEMDYRRCQQRSSAGGVGKEGIRPCRTGGARVP